MKIKKIVPTLVLSILLVGLAMPLLASAQTEPLQSCTIRKDLSGLTSIRCPAQGQVCLYSNDAYDCGICCIMNSVYNITDWVFLFVMAIAILMVIISAFIFVTAGGDAEKTKKARDYMMYAAIGIGVGLLAKAVPVIVRTIVGA